MPTATSEDTTEPSPSPFDLAVASFSVLQMVYRPACAAAAACPEDINLEQKEHAAVEMAIGLADRNSKNSIPREILARLHPESVTISDGQTMRIAREEVYDLEELIIAQARKASGPIIFGKPVAYEHAA